jgi:CRP-like cAMP-binding protein
MTKDRRTKDEFDLRKVLTGRGPGQSRLKLAPEHVIYAQGDAADALFYVESGWVKMSAVVPSGKEPVILSAAETNSSASAAWSRHAAKRRPRR